MIASLFILISFITGYLLAKSFTSTLERKLELSALEIVRINVKREEEKIKYLERIGLLNTAFEQYKRIEK